MKTCSIKLRAAIMRRAEYHRSNANDPHNISTAVYVALIEIAEALKESRSPREMRGWWNDPIKQKLPTKKETKK